MNVKKCDRCGCIFERNKEDTYKGGKIMLFAFDNYWIGEKPDLDADLCEKCSEDFEKWLAGDDVLAVVNVDSSEVKKEVEKIENNSFLAKRFLEVK